MGPKYVDLRFRTDFGANVSPREMFGTGSFGGTYWRPIKSKFHARRLRDVHVKSGFKQMWWSDIDEEMLSSPTYVASRNRYGVRVGSSLEEWERKGWITALDPYGWVQWYCAYVAGRRNEPEDERQIGRWRRLAGPKGRFRRTLVTYILRKGATWDDETVSPRIRQTLQHWGYRLTKADFDADVRRRRAEESKKRNKKRAR